MKPANGAEFSVEAGDSAVDRSAEGGVKDRVVTEHQTPALVTIGIGPDLQVEIGDVWWIPEQFNGYPGGKDRFCLVVALETSRGLALSGRVHFVPGSTKPSRSNSGHPEIVFQAGEAGLPELTYFNFWFSNDLGIQTLTSCGRLCGKVEAQRITEIRTAIAASRRPGLKRVAGC
jgi:hypothetical protein